MLPFPSPLDRESPLGHRRDQFLPHQQSRCLPLLLLGPRRPPQLVEMLRILRADEQVKIDKAPLRRCHVKPKFHVGKDQPGAG